MLQILTEYEKTATDILIDLIKHSVVHLVYKKEHKQEMLNRIDEYLPNLLDYSSLDKNKDYLQKEFRRIKSKSRKFANLTLVEVEELFKQTDNNSSFDV